MTGFELRSFGLDHIMSASPGASVCGKSTKHWNYKAFEDSVWHPEWLQQQLDLDYGIQEEEYKRQLRWHALESVDQLVASFIMAPYALGRIAIVLSAMKH